MEEEVKDTMDGSAIALEQALFQLGGHSEDGEESSDADSETEEAALEGAIDRIVGPGMDSTMPSADNCIYQAKAIPTGYGHPPRASEPSVNDNSARTPAIAVVAPSCESPASKPSSLTLMTIIEDDRSFLIFRRFLKDQCITRNLNFWLACEHYRLLPPGGQNMLQKVARAIYVKFIKYSAPQKVNILDQTKKMIKMCLELHTPLTPQLYQLAQREIWEMMERNEFHQFLVSDAFADCARACSILTGMVEPTGQAPGLLYTPNRSEPGNNVCGIGSLLDTGSEDSNSVASFTSASDEGGPIARSAVCCQLTRPILSGGGARKALSDTDSRMRRTHAVALRHPQRNGAMLPKESLTKEEFFELVRDRLLAVQLDRDSTRKKTQDLARKKGKAYDEIMAIEWYDHPDMVKYLVFDEESVSASTRPRSPSAKNSMSPSVAKHVMSPTIHSPAGTPQPSASSASSKPTRAHLYSLALREAQEALRDLEITNQVNKRRRAHLPPGGGSTCSSVWSTTSDSGVGDSWVTGTNDGWQPAGSGGITPFNNVHAYLRDVDQAKHAMGERDRMVQAAAITLISNTPKPEALKPRVLGPREPRGRQNRSHEYVHNYPGAYTSDDSSSCYTMTSKSSTSDLFIPRRMHQPSFYSDSDDSHYYVPNRYHQHIRRLTTPKRSHPKHPSPAPSSVLSHQKMPSSRATPSRPTNDVLVVYHLDDFPTPYAKRVGGSEITLGEFKERVFARRGEYRYFFKSYCDDLCMEIMEEFTDDSMILPLTQGKVVGKVEKA